MELRQDSSCQTTAKATVKYLYVCLAVCPIGRGEMGCGGSKHSMFDGAPLISVHELLASPPAQGIVPGYHRPRLARGGRDRAGHGSAGEREHTVQLSTMNVLPIREAAHDTLTALLFERGGVQSRLFTIEHAAERDRARSGGRRRRGGRGRACRDEHRRCDGSGCY